jgi:DNA repair protein RadC
MQSLFGTEFPFPVFTIPYTEGGDESMKNTREIVKPPIDRPREKLVRFGPAHLSGEELVQVLIGSGTPEIGVEGIAAKVFPFVEDNASLLKKDYAEFIGGLKAQKGVGEARACLVAAALELAERVRGRRELVVREAGDVVPLLSSLAAKKQEYFTCISLNGGNRIISRRVITIGLLDQSLVHPREVFADALGERAAKIIVAHNHPAGDAHPSKEDLQVTEKLARAALILGIELLDHVIITESGYFSFREEGLL